MMDKWDIRFLDQAAHTSTWSKDPSTKVGAVIVDKRNRVLGLGYNGFPRGVSDHPARYNDRPTKYKYVVHAELNAILNAGRSVEGCRIYVYPFAPCHECAKAIIQSGISEVVAPVSDVERWRDSFDVAYTMFLEADVKLRLVQYMG